jgi:hypothetical protein
MMDDFFGSPWLWGIIGLVAGIGIDAKFLSDHEPVNPIVALNEMRSDWTSKCIRDATPQNYPSPPEAINNCTDKGLKIIPIDQKIPSADYIPGDPVTGQKS